MGRAVRSRNRDRSQQKSTKVNCLHLLTFVDLTPVHLRMPSTFGTDWTNLVVAAICLAFCVAAVDFCMALMVVR